MALTAYWRHGLVAEFDALGPEVEGRVLEAAPPGARVLPAELLRDPAILRQAIHESGESLSHAVPDTSTGSVKLAGAASRFVRHYVSSVTAAAIVGLVRGVGLDLGADRCVKVIENGLPRRHLLPESDDGIVTCAERQTRWRVDGASVTTVDEMRRYVWERLYADHLAPLFEVVCAETPVTARVLWSNAAEWVAYTAELAIVHLGADEAAPFVDEANALLDVPSLPGVDGANPLIGLVEWVPVDEPDFPFGLHTRRQCCITYMLPARTGYLCGNCPFLPLEERIALVRERRRTDGVGGGPAQRRSIEFGRRKFRLST